MWLDSLSQEDRRETNHPAISNYSEQIDEQDAVKIYCKQGQKQTDELHYQEDQYLITTSNVRSVISDSRAAPAASSLYLELNHKINWQWEPECFYSSAVLLRAEHNLKEHRVKWELSVAI